MSGPEASSPTNDAPAHVPCNEVVEILTEYLEGALDPDMERRVEAHLDVCPPCVVFLEQLRNTIDSLEQLPVENLPSETVDALEDAFRSFHRGGQR
jgi:anti-sigma factor RsiW